MKKLVLTSLICLLVIFSFQVNGQSPFSMVIEATDTYPLAKSIIRTPDNGYIITAGAQQRGLIIKLDSNFNMLWNTSYMNNPNVYPSVSIDDAISNKDSSIIAVGRDIISDYPSNNYFYSACTKLKSNGATLWHKSFSPNNCDKETFAYSVCGTFDSQFIITGYTLDTAANLAEIFASKINSSGSFQWTRLYKTTNHVFGNKIIATPDSGYLIVGRSSFDGFFLLKLLSNGDISWSKKYNIDSTYNDRYGVVCLNNGFVILTNTSLMKTDFSGNVIWCKTYHDSIAYNGDYGDNMNRLYITHDGGFVFISRSTCSGSTVIKTDSAGNILWSEELEVIATDVIETKDRGICVIGYGPMCGGCCNAVPQIGIIKLDSLGNGVGCINQDSSFSLPHAVMVDTLILNQTNGVVLYSATPTIGSINLFAKSGCVMWTSGIDETSTINNQIIISPNPTPGPIQIQLPQQFGKVKSLEIYNCMGQLQTNQNDITNVDISMFSDGLYFIVVTNFKGEVLRGKVIKE